MRVNLPRWPAHSSPMAVPTSDSHVYNHVTLCIAYSSHTFTAACA